MKLILYGHTKFKDDSVPLIMFNRDYLWSNSSMGYSPPQSLTYLQEAIKHLKSEALPVITPSINTIRGSNLDR